MGKEIVPAGQSISIIILFIIGSSLFMGTAGVSGNSSWIALILAVLLTIPLMLIYARLHTLFPGKNLYDMLIAAFGGFVGRIFSCLYIWYTLHLGSLVLRNYGEFSKTVALTSTPMLAPMLIVGLLCVWVVNAGMEVVGRSAKFLMLFTFAVIVVVQLLSIPKFEFEHMKPLLDSGWGPVFQDVAGAFTFPFAEIVVFLGAFSVLPRKGSAARVLISGVVIAGIIIIGVSVRNLLVLGPEILSSLYFPSYVAVSRINIGDFLTRIEGSSAIIFIASLFIKVSLCLYVACQGIATVFKLQSYRSVVLQTGLIMVCMADFIYKDITQMQYFAYHIYKIYALPFQMFIPLLLWITAEIMARRGGGREEQVE